MSLERSQLEQLSDLVAETKALLLAEKARGVLYLPVSSEGNLGDLSAEVSVSQSAPSDAAYKHKKTSYSPRRKSEPKADVASRNITDIVVPSALKGLYEESRDCTNCINCNERKNVVFGEGSLDSDLFIIGEAPSAIEDMRGKPFVGPIGEMLNKMLVNVLGLTRDKVYLVNAVKCRVRGGKAPGADALHACNSYTRRQIDIVKPKVILCLGDSAAKVVLKESRGVEEMRGTWHSYGEVPVLVSYNPAHLLKHPEFKRMVFNDLKILSSKYDEVGGVK